MIATSRHTVKVDERFLLFSLFGVISLSGIVFIEPAPYDLALLFIGGLCLLFGLRIPAKLAPLIFCFALIVVFGFLSSFYSSDLYLSAMHIVTTTYLIVGTIILASIIAANPLKTISCIMNGYIVAALIATLLGLIGYLDLIPGSYEKFTLYGRLRGTFKDPNVYGPFVITPLLYMGFRAITRPDRYLPLHVLGSLVLTTGLFLSFSRGAWGHLIVSGLILLPMILMILPDNRSRLRLIGIALFALLVLGFLVWALLGSSTIAEMFTQRAQITQSYDVGGRGRFDGQRLAMDWILSRPLGAGVGEFSLFWGEQSHNIYISHFLFSGWAGGFGYIALILLTFARAAVFIRYNLAIRPYLMVFLATFGGLVFEGFLVDTDHWRHFYLIVAAIWGLTCAPWEQCQTAPIARAKAQ